MPTVTELRTQRAAIVANARQLVDRADAEKREMSTEENENFSKAMTDADRLANEIRTAERKEWVESQEAELRSSTGRRVPAGQIHRSDEVTDQDRRESVRAWALMGTDRARMDADTVHRAATCGIQLHATNLTVRALSKGTASAGGHTVPVGMAGAIERAMKYYAPVRNVASTIVTDSGSDLEYPRVSDIANSASIVSEAASIAVNVDPSFDKVVMKAWKYATTIVKLSIELLQDTAVDVEQLLGTLLGERIGRGQAAHFMTGNSTTQPQGLATGAAVGVNLASGNAITFDKIIDLMYSVDRVHRDNGTFFAHDETIAALVKLKDSDGQYLWQPSVQVGEPDRLRNHPVLCSNDLTSITSPGDNQPLVLFGNASKYLIRDVRGSAQVTRLNELYAATGEVGFVLIQRSDGRYIGHSGCVKSLNSFDAE